MPIVTHTVRISVAGEAEMGGYVARPAAADALGGVVVIGELFGLSAHVRSVCERLADLGYMALAPDMYHRSEPWVELPEDEPGRARGFELLGGLTRRNVMSDVGAAADELRRLGCPRVGLLGLSVGGHVAYLAAGALQVSAIAVAYPGWLSTTGIAISRPEPTLTFTSRIQAPVLFVVGEADQLIPAAEREQIREALRHAAVRHELVVYPGVGHGFLNPRRASYDAGAASDAWRRIDSLFATEFGSA